MERMERITSRQNAVVKRFRDLVRVPGAAGSARGEHASRAGHTAEVLLDGLHLVQEALACDIPIDLAAVSDQQITDERSPLGSVVLEVRRRGGTVVRVSESVLAAISPVQHPSGVVAIARARPADVGVVFSTFTELPLVFVLAGLQDPGNIGAIVRAAAAFGASGIVAIEGSANPFGWKALRGAMGGTFRLPMAPRATLAEVTAAAAQRGVRLVAAVPRGGTPLPQLDLRGPSAIILGGEGAGLSDATIAAVETTLTIPMQPAVESLNVAIAAALILYEATRQRDATPRRHKAGA